MKVFVVGMNPSGKAKKGTSSSSPTLRKLESWMSTAGVHFFSFMNVVQEPGEVKMSMVDSIAIQEACKDYDKVIALGGFVSRTLNTIGVDHFKLPHPSPRNRQLNDKQFETHIISKCKDYLND